MVNTDFSDTARGSFRVLFIYLFIALMFMLSLANIPLLGAGIVRPAFLLIAIYFWTITRPSLLPLPVVFVIGLLYDVASASVLGLHTFAFMVVVILVRSQRRYLLGQTWPVLWVGFAIAALILNVIQALVFLAGSGHMPSLWLIFANVLVSALSYPLAAPLMIGLNRFLTVAKHDYT